jgi:hypothetical protein
MKVLELSYNAEQHLLQQLYTTAKQLEEAKLYMTVYNNAAAISSNQPRVLQMARLNQVPTEVGTQQASRIPASQDQPVYRLAIPAVVN